MKNRKPAETQENSSPPGFGPISRLGEELLKKHPEMVQKVIQFHETDPLARVMEIIHDTFPYDLKNEEFFCEGVGLCLEGNYLEAMDIFQDILRLEPEAYPVCYFLGYARGMTGNLKGEIDFYRKVIKLKPDHAQIYCSIGAAYWRMGKNNKALEAFKRSVSLAPDFSALDYWLTFVVGRMRPDQKSMGKDDKVYKEEVRCHAHVCYMLGNAYVEYGLHLSARQAFKRAVRIKEDFAGAYYQLGSLHIKRLRNPKRASKYLEKAEQLFIKHNDLQKAALAHQLCCDKEEIKDKNKAAEEWLKEGLRLQRNGRYQGSVDSYRVAISFKPDFLDAYYNMGVAYGSLQDAGVQKISRAIGAFKKAIGIKPDFIHAYIALGASFIKVEEFENAIQILNEAIKLEPENPDIYYYLGIVFRLTGKKTEAIEALKKAISINPESVQAQYSLGLAFLDLKNYHEAGEAFQETLRIKPDSVDAHFMLGSLYQSSLTNNEKSLFHLKKAEKLYLKLEDYQNSARVRQLIESLSM